MRTYTHNLFIEEVPTLITLFLVFGKQIIINIKELDYSLCCFDISHTNFFFWLTHSLNTCDWDKIFKNLNINDAVLRFYSIMDSNIN